MQVLLTMEGNVLGLYLPVLDIDLVTTDYNRDVFTDSHYVSVPVRNILVGETTGYVEHDNGALTLNTEGISLLVLWTTY